MKKITLIFMLFISFCGFAQLSLENFEGTWTPLTAASGPAGPSGWYIHNVTGPAQVWSQGTNPTDVPATFGTKAAYINKENVATGTVAEDWLITPLFTVPNNAQLKFWSRLTQLGNQGSNYKVMIGTDNTDLSTFTELQSWTEETINVAQLEYEEKVVTIPATASGQQRYIAFVMTNDDGDRWFVDNVIVAEQCFVPTALAANPSGTSAVLSWTSTATNFEVEVLPATGTQTGVGVATTGTSYTTPATLTPSTAYQYFVRAVCGEGNYSDWAGPFNFFTSQIPGTLNYTDGFESTLSWSFVNGTQTNQWVHGTATANGGTHSLYISNDGTNNAYAVSPTSASSTVMAYRDIQMPATLDQLSLSFDWKGQGESCCDYLRVWLAPVSYTPVAGTQTTTANSGGAVQIGGNMNVNGSWQTYNTTINAAAYANTTVRLIFEWRNDGSVGTQPPAAIDNINLSLITCPAPTNFALTEITHNSAAFSWTGPTSVTPTFDFYYSTNNTAPSAATSPTANTPNPYVAIPGLAPSTTYYIWVRSNCGSGDASTWVGPIAFTTTQVPATLNYTQDFETTNGFGFVNGTQTNKWFYGTAVSNSPTHSLYVTNDNGVTNSYSNNSSSVVHAYRDIAVPSGVSDVDFSFDWKNVGETGWDYIRVWVVPVTYMPVAGTQTSATNSGGGVQLGGNFVGNTAWTTYNQTFSAAAYAGQTMRLVFEWRNDGFGGVNPPGAIDNVNLSIVTCPKPLNLTATVTSTNATLNWTPQGTETSWEVYVVPQGTAAPTAATTGTVVSTHPYIYSPLTPTTAYQYYVRAICSDSDKSTWAGPFAFTTSVGNDECVNAIEIPVNTGQTCTTETDGGFLGANASTTPACFGNNGPDVWFEFTALNTSHVIQLNDILPYTTAAQNIVLSLYEANCGELGDAIYCSSVNYMLATGLVPGDTYLVRATLNPPTGTNPALNTTFDICVTTPAPPTSGNATECEITTINPSFELPNINYGGLNNSTVSQNVVPGWKTTATDGMIEFWPVPNNVGVPAAAGTTGTWFIELNANQSSAVYQDFATPQPTTFTIQFAHRGRQGVDVMRLKAGSADQPIADYPQIGPNFSDGTTAWGYYGQDGSLTYTVPAGQTTTRFVFEAVSTATGDPTVGNFLDEIRFTANNGITSPNPAAADCTNNSVDVTAIGDGTWVAHTDNPAATAIADDNANSTTISGFTVPGTYYYDWTTDFCTSTLEVVYTAPVIALPVAETSIVYCEGATATQLTATALTGNTLNWYDVEAGGTPLAQAPTPDTSVAGTVTYYVSQTESLCESPRLAITVTVNDVPDAPLSADVTYCQNSTAAPLTATAEGTNTLNWYDVATGGTALAAAPTPDTATTGTTTYYVSQSTAEGCESPRTAVVVTINAITTPGTEFVLPATVCIADVNPVATLDTASVTGGTFTADGGLTINATTGEIDLTSTTGGTYNITYTVAADPANCLLVGTTTKQIVITPLVVPTVTLSYPDTCALQANITPVLTGGNAAGTFTADAGVSINAETGVIDLSDTAAGTYNVTYSFPLDVTTCTDAFTVTVPVNITAPTTPVVGFGYVDVCASAANQLPVLSAGFQVGGTFTAPAGLAINATTGEIDMANSTAGTYEVTYTFEADAVNCIAANAATFTFTINPVITPVVSFDYDDTFCFGTTGALPDLATDFYVGGTFTATGGLNINPSTGEITNMASVAAGQYSVTYTVTADPATCNTGGTSTVNFTINGEIEFTIEGDCSGPAYVLTATPENNSFDPELVTYQWSINGVSVGNDENTFNVSDYLNSAATPVTLPIDVTLSVNSNGCNTPVVFTVTDAACEIQRGISPDGSIGQNDYFDLASFSVKKLIIFNRYGKEVYSKNNYTTEWHGQTNGNDDLPTGTYFYVIERNSGENKTGWIYINRQN